ncbi:MAG: DUF3971 domain-containing protein [Alphaproteobacteria bacterium]|nr:DUF3971 domain-containing protein [Alphaproteobacteria bacterium]MBU0802037.1 DUF3971 domain-containing protein [Alphaproteobacteria bacterium]MBU0872356.1 DUF3971 domain-containing protein [Alphaproteobacteria bacterium]MBU1399536.1 DUF3971 domain-containing protein [Alphaproteobacteria bacterium]MBU1589922.1 DUF3971 domain-containing protein [Alphaproteobacteria bacterium]
MDHEHLKHEKIRFRRDEITDLETLPSAGNLDPKPRRRWVPARLKKVVGYTLAGLVGLLVVAAVAVYAIGVSGIGSERLRVAAEQGLEEFAGYDIDASVGPARITFDASRFLALEVRDVSLKNAADGSAIADAGLVRFGVRLLPLLSGELRLSSARLSDARIVAPDTPQSDTADWSAMLRGDDGLLSTDRIIDIVFGGVHKAFDRISSNAMRRISLQDVDLVLPGKGEAGRLRVATALLSETSPGKLALDAQVEVAGRSLHFEASATRDLATQRIAALEMRARETAADGAVLDSGSRLGLIDVVMGGSEGGGGNPAGLRLGVALKGSGIDLGKHGVLEGDLELRAAFVAGSRRIGIERLRAMVGRTIFDFRGVIDPATTTDGTDGAYRYELASARSLIAPEGSPEPAMTTSVRLTGQFSETERRLSADQIVVQTGRGEVLGTASVQMVEDGAPGMSAAFSVHDMSVSHVKQLWPWFSANKAREWVMQNLFGGRITDATLQFQVEPRRLGNGVPLTGDEVFGTFAVEGTRFDTAGLIPPVRDATGVVGFKGNDVDIALSSGTVYLPSGRTVAASNGTLAVKQANVPPVIGSLDIDVVGDAPAVAELASYDPINAMRFVGLPPQAFSGDVSGHVTAEIPLQRGIDASTLAWNVALDYENLAISEPIDGQMVTEAAGTITVDRTKAVIDAKAKLNGVPAEIEATEPVGKSGTQRQRLITMALTDKTREVMAPGISDLVKGTVKVTVDATEPGRKQIKADLTGAQLDIPWAGWTKGPGIASDVSFLLEADGDSVTLSDFFLSGSTFGINGDIALSGGGLSSAMFAKVRLNRDDSVAVAIKRSGKGLSVDIRGASLDARSVVRQFTADTSTATKASNTGSVAVHLDVDTLTGFHGERFSGVKLDYSGSGDKVNSLVVTAKASSGAGVQIRNIADGGSRSMQMQSDDAGAVLRFLDIYEHMEGGKIALALNGASDGQMTGQVDARDFFIVNEPRMNSIVATKAPTENGRSMSLNEAVKRDIDTSRVKFDRGFTQISKGTGELTLANGVLRGPVIGATFQGTLYDKQGNMDMTGTFMPAYGINRLFGELPIVGLLLGNGRDRGLLGVTFKLEGDADSPDVSINPLSIVAPGIFRSIFEFR